MAWKDIQRNANITGEVFAHGSIEENIENPDSLPGGIAKYGMEAEDIASTDDVDGFPGEAKFVQDAAIQCMEGRRSQGDESEYFAIGEISLLDCQAMVPT